MHLKGIIAMTLLLILATLLYTFHKVGRIHLMLYRIEDQLPRRLDNLFRQIEALKGLYMELDFQRSLPASRLWAGSPDFLLQLALHTLSERPQMIVECSSGISTVVRARCAEVNGQGHVYSLEHSPDFAEKTRKDLKKHNLSQWATVIDAPLKDYMLPGHDNEWLWYSLEQLPQMA